MHCKTPMASLMTLSLCLWLALAPGQALAAEVVVSVKTSSIKASKDFAASSLARLSQGQRLEVLKKEGDWYQVRQGTVSGWVHGSAVASAQRQQASMDQALSGLSGKASGPAAKGKGFTEDEVSLAGKGFNAQVEKEYQKSNTKADFQAVDRMEKLTASPQTITAFAKAGALNPRADAKAAAKSSQGTSSSKGQSAPGFLN